MGFFLFQNQKPHPLHLVGPNASVAQTLVGNYVGLLCKTITPLQG
uniref:Uncharacterized protein n=1 Tax=Rhizophora mucronata TaxID=61149 RepID=A0A2P2N408_RHIMU